MKRVLCFSLLVVFVLMLTVPSFAIRSGGQEALDFTSRTPEEHGEGWDWDPGTSTLTLSGLGLYVSDVKPRVEPGALILPGGSTIALSEGSENSIVFDISSCTTDNAYGIYCNGQLTITGAGRLSVEVAGTNTQNSYGVYAIGDITIQGGAEVSASAGDVQEVNGLQSSGVISLGSLSVCEAALTAVSLSLENAAESCGISSGWNVNLENAAVVAYGGTASEASFGINSVYGMVISGGKLISTSAESGSVSAGVCCGGGAEISAGADVYVYGDSAAVSSGLDASEGLVSISGDSTRALFFGGAEPENVLMTRSADCSTLAGGLCAGSLSISGGMVLAGSASGSGGAILSSGEVCISGGQVTTISGGEDSLFSVAGPNGGLCPGALTVSGGSFNASVAQYAADTLNFEVSRGDGRFAYFETAEEALEYAGDADGVVIRGVGASAGLRSCSVSISSDGETVDFTRVLPEGFTVTLPAAPTRSGYIFLGWCGSGATYGAGDVVTVVGDVDFVPSWCSLPLLVEPEPEPEQSEPAAVFADVSEGDWFFEAVEYVSSAGLMQGVAPGQFAPDAELSRAMFWTSLARAEGVDTDAGALWYSSSQEWAAACGISDCTEPEADITREQLVTMLYRLCGEPGNSAALDAPDSGAVSSWAREAMAWALELGLIEGDETGAIRPADTATRAEAAAILMRLAQN